MAKTVPRLLNILAKSQSQEFDKVLTHATFNCYIQQWKYQNNVWNLFKVNNEETRTTSIVDFE